MSLKEYELNVSLKNEERKSIPLINNNFSIPFSKNYIMTIKLTNQMKIECFGKIPTKHSIYLTISWLYS